ncbi:hypothetical protein [Streptomyces sp. NPDC051219]|uniref:hypothetical protein n=1 Tax=Streptomyces sp. NPDC051219 TaxID=3155283 RepID=UPI003412A2B9
MTTAQHLATIDILRTREFPSVRGRSDVGSSGPGYHLAELSTSEEFWEDDGTRRAQVEDQYAAECAALAQALSVRWGEPQVFSLWSLLIRGMEGEGIPEPWNQLSGSVVDLHLWRIEERWLALGVAQWAGELPFQLVAAVTEIDPP